MNEEEYLGLEGYRATAAQYLINDEDIIVFGTGTPKDPKDVALRDPSQRMVSDMVETEERRILRSIEADEDRMLNRAVNILNRRDLAEVAGELGTGRVQDTQEDNALLEIVATIDSLVAKQATTPVAYRVSAELETIKKSLNKINGQPLWEEE